MISSTKERINHSQLEKAASRKPWYLLLGEIVLWQIVAVLVVEASLAIAGLGEEEIFKLDPQLGFRHMSNKKVTWRSEGFAGSYFNADGLREAGITVAKPASTYRIALLGDSLTESLQVTVDKSFGQQVQAAMQRDLARNVQVINFGTSGYSTVQEFLQLKQQVMKYKPDLVLLCYNSRDCFENWSPPDEVLTNVRPAALRLPGHDLIVDSSPVTQWMKTPRARFMKQVEFLRQHSRLWGLYSAAELDLSMHNETYKRLIFFLTKPGKAIRQSISELKNELSKWNAAGSKDSQAHSDKKGQSAKPDKTKAESVAAKSPSSPTAAVLSENPLPSAKKESDSGSRSGTKKNTAALSEKTEEEKGRRNYESIISGTLSALLAEMKKTCSAGGARLAVVALPVRSDLSAREGMDTSFNGYAYKDELRILQAASEQNSLPLINIHESAKTLSANEKDNLFYLVHLTPKGHDFVSSRLAPALEKLLTEEAQ
ncbi:MAG: SGNH/GDSL hydrolase family protein [Candidatus Obscuribacterales bacterium]|nr:SGNH/GDSL hydrolase family protein [Candidatus Obscuribacterales bacterium]